MKTFHAALLVASGFITIAVSTAALAADTTVTIPYGDWIGSASGVIASVVGLGVAALVGFAVKFLPAPLKALATEKNINAVDQLLYRAVDFGVAKAAEAAKGKEIDFDLRNEALAHAAQYALDHGAKALVDWAGGAAGIEEKLFSRMPLPSGLKDRILGWNSDVPPAVPPAA